MSWALEEILKMSKNFKQAIKTKDELLLLTCPIDITRSQMEVGLGKGDYDAVYFDGQQRMAEFNALERVLAGFCSFFLCFSLMDFS